MTCENFLLIFFPYEVCNIHPNIRGITKKTFLLIKIIHNIFGNIILGACYRFMHLGFFSIYCLRHYPFETLAVWISFMRLVLCLDIHPNPGPAHSNQFAAGFLSFCNWNLNTLCKNDFTRITLLEAHNTEHNYDIISLCETSLDDKAGVPEMTGYKFHSCNHPDGNRSGGVGIFFKESLPLREDQRRSFI